MRKWRKKVKAQMILIYGVENISLTEKKCIPCEGGIPPLGSEEIATLLKEIDENWVCLYDHHIERDFKFPDFEKALQFVNFAGEICEQEAHHADFQLSWGKVKVMIWTHKIDGLTESDFILAAKIDQILR